jgi:hypothetical protein
VISRLGVSHSLSTSQLRIVSVDFRDRNAVTLSDVVAGDVKLLTNQGIVDYSLTLSGNRVVILLRVSMKNFFGVLDYLNLSGPILLEELKLLEVMVCI